MSGQRCSQLASIIGKFWPLYSERTLPNDASVIIEAGCPSQKILAELTEQSRQSCLKSRKMEIIVSK